MRAIADSSSRISSIDCDSALLIDPDPPQCGQVCEVLDCSDGEVARATLSDSKFGAWLETVTDYLSYFVVLGGMFVGVVLFFPEGVVGSLQQLPRFLTRVRRVRDERPPNSSNERSYAPLGLPRPQAPPSSHTSTQRWSTCSKHK